MITDGLSGIANLIDLQYNAFLGGMYCKSVIHFYNNVTGYYGLTFCPRYEIMMIKWKTTINFRITIYKTKEGSHSTIF